MKQESKIYKTHHKNLLTKKKLNQDQRGERTKSILCYTLIAILPIVLYSYRFLPKVESVSLMGYQWDFNGFTSSYSFLFAFLSKIAPILFISVFFLQPKPITLFKRKLTIKHFLFPSLLIYCYQLIFIIAPVDKIDEGFYSELIGWSVALIMSMTVIFSNEFFILVSKIFHAFYLKLTLNSSQIEHLKNTIRGFFTFMYKDAEEKQLIHPEKSLDFRKIRLELTNKAVENEQEG